MTGIPATYMDLLDPHASPWGLRGDPILHGAMKEALAGQSLAPDAATQDATSKAVTGGALAHAAEHIKVGWARRGNGGMPNGAVSRDYRRDRIKPVMLTRLHAPGRPALKLPSAPRRDLHMNADKH